ncbi:MAG: AEC family transporter [Clostridia bacterium]|nr:AEC family transporter [Clostridia bacterium]
MEIFNLTLVQMMNMFFLMLVGFILVKCKILPEGSDRVISRLETYALVPALTLCNQMKNCTVKNFAENLPNMISGLIVVLIAIGLAYPLSCLFVKADASDSKLLYKKQIYKYALAFGNYGYVGNFLVLSIWGQEMLFKYMMFTFFPAIMCSAWGVYTLIPKSENSPGLLSNLKNGLIKPPFISLLVGMFLGLTKLGNYFPSFVHTAFENAGNCMGPLAMILAGIVIGEFNFKELITNKKVYIVSLARLILIPSLFILILKMIGVNKDVITFTLIAFAAPLGLNTIVYPSAFGGDTKTGASMTMVSQTLSVITIPLMYLLFIDKM